MNRFTALAKTSFAEIDRFDHPPGVEHTDPEAEVPASYGVCFVESGSFSVVRGAERWSFGSNDVELTFPGEVKKYSHATVEPLDVCLNVRFAPAVVEETLGESPRARGPLRVPASDRTLFERYRLTEALKSGDALSLDVASQRLIRALLDGMGEQKGELHRSRRFPSYLKRVRDAVELLSHESAHQHSVFELARRVGVSPYHFTRLFTALVGSPPHRYLVEIRLRNAALRLSQGDTVTAAAFDCGFQNLSHFVRVFRKRFGMPPGQYKNRPPRRG